MVKKRGISSKAAKKPIKKVDLKKNKNGNPPYKHELTLGQKSADKISEFGGSWTFLIMFGVFILIWVAINTVILIKRPFDPYPYILLNLALSLLAAVQAPIILMTQNRQTERDRNMAKYDYQVNRKAEREIQNMQRDLNQVKRLIKTFCNVDKQIKAAKKPVKKRR
jgi:uncharacterized membrane protein